MAPSSSITGIATERDRLGLPQVRSRSKPLQPNVRGARSVSRSVGAPPNTARDRTNNGKRSNKGFSHHIATPAHGRASSIQAAALSSANKGRLAANQASQMMRA